MFLGLIQPAVILWLISDGAFEVATHAERAWQIFSQTIQAEGPLDAVPLNQGRDPRPNEKGKAKMKTNLVKITTIGALLAAATLLPRTAKAHCDTMDGPVVLADQFFFETLVRVHRAGEGAPFTGLRPAGAELGPAIELETFARSLATSAQASSPSAARPGGCDCGCGS